MVLNILLYCYTLLKLIQNKRFPELIDEFLLDYVKSFKLFRVHESFSNIDKRIGSILPRDDGFCDRIEKTQCFQVPSFFEAFQLH